MPLISILNLTLAFGSLALTVVTIVLCVDYFVYKGKYLASRLDGLTGQILMFVTIFSVVMSLTYSEYFGFVPCSLCWLQRIAIYPQALMSVLAFKLRDQAFFPIYGIGLSIFGFLIAVYQYIYQMLPKETLASGFVPCLLDGSGANCADKIIDLFGFVTFPFMSAITFAFLIIIYLYAIRSNRSHLVAS